MDQEIRNKLRNVVTQCRKLLEDDVRSLLEGTYSIFARKDQVTADPDAPMTHLSDEERAARKDILDHFAHIKACGFKPKEALDQLVREIAFTHLNRLCAYKLMEARDVYVGGQKFREAVSRGVNSNGVKFYLADHPEDLRLFETGHQDVAYRHFLDWLGGLLSDEIGVLFNPNDSANRLYPRQKTLDEVLDLLNGGGIKAEETELRAQWPPIWSQDETIGWVYQYFTPKELRDQARKESQAPRNSYELAFRNQFFTPRYVVEFLTDNTLGRIWYEMRKGETKLKDQCRYMVRRPTEIFLKDGGQPPKDAAEGKDDLSQEELLKLPVHIPHRPKKDPRELKILDPACGSGHFLLYCFDLLLTIYEEAYADPDLGPALKKDYPTLDALKRDVPRLILAHNLHGIDIDLRASQIAALALWLRCQRAYQDMGFKKDRPQITRSNFVCAEPMPGEEQMLKEFVGQLEPKVLGQVVEVVFDKMKLAGEAGSLLKIEEEIRDAIREAKRQYAIGGISVQRTLFDKPTEPVVKVFSVKDITDTQFFEGAEAQVIEALRSYAEKAQNGQRLQRRLFSEDAVRGFAFVDLCQKRYDVVLMNPPFGAASENSKSYVFSRFQREKIELGACFITDMLDRLVPGTGALGIIANRNILYSGTLEEWRRRCLTDIAECADLGHGVLDALVETAAFVLRSFPTAPPHFFKLLDSSMKGEDLELECSVAEKALKRRTFARRIEYFNSIDGFPFAYWLPSRLLSSLASSTKAEDHEIIARAGLQTCDNFRFLRLAWELPSNLQSGWVRLTKGGEYQPFWGDVPLLLKWGADGDELKAFIETLYSQWSKQIPSSNLYLYPGATYSERTTSGLSLRVLPSGCIFDKVGPFVGFRCDFQAENDTEKHDVLLAVIGLSYTSPIRTVVESAVGLREATESGSPARHFLASMIQKLPLPLSDPIATSKLANSVRRIVEAQRLIQALDEPNSYWQPIPAWNTHNTIRELALTERNTVLDHLTAVYEEFASLETYSCNTLRLDPESTKVVREIAGTEFFTYAVCPLTGDDETTDRVTQLWTQDEDSLVDVVATTVGASASVLKKSFVGDRRIELVAGCLKMHPLEVISRIRQSSAISDRDCRRTAERLVSVAIGAIVGRLEWRLLRNPMMGDLPSIFDPLPRACPFEIAPEGGGTHDGMDTTDDGILVDDADHSWDVVRRTRQFCETIWAKCSEPIEEDVCRSLGVKELREYLRKPGKGGFWDDHLSRYSKSRRNAPIYWLLQSSKKNYALWLYYHRLDKDLLFKALVNYVEPKIRLETSRLESLRSQKAAAGDTGKEAKRLAKEVERQEDFLSELRDFEDKLRRAANLHLEPDLNDGVVLNIAPLWELVPWKEAKSYWDELREGKYEWSSIGKQLRQRGLVK